MKTLHSTKSYTVYEKETINNMKYIAVKLANRDHVIDLNSLLNVGYSLPKKEQVILKSVARRFAGMTKEQLDQWNY